MNITVYKNSQSKRQHDRYLLCLNVDKSLLHVRLPPASNYIPLHYPIRLPKLDHPNPIMVDIIIDLSFIC